MRYHVRMLLCLLMGLAVAGCASMLQSLWQVVRQRKHGVPVMDCLRVLLCLVVVLVGGGAQATGPRCDEAKRAAVSAAARCDAAARQCQRTKTDVDCTRATNICEAAMALAEKMADVCSATEAAVDVPRLSFMAGSHSHSWYVADEDPVGDKYQCAVSGERCWCQRMHRRYLCRGCEASRTESYTSMLCGSSGGLSSAGHASPDPMKDGYRPGERPPVCEHTFTDWKEKTACGRDGSWECSCWKERKCTKCGHKETDDHRPSC